MVNIFKGSTGVDKKIKDIRLVLIYPPIADKYNKMRDSGLTPPLHLMALAASVPYNVKIIDGTHDNIESILTQINNFNPNAIGMNVDITNYDNAIKIANQTNQRIILGGNYAAFLANQILSNQKRIEAICFNDGEKALKGFIENTPNTPNLITRENKNPRLEFSSIWNNLTPAYDLIDIEKYFTKQKEIFGKDFKMMQFYGQKGCVNTPHCTFCGRYEDGMRLRNPDIYTAEIKQYIKKHNLTEVWDRSDSYLQNKNWFKTVQKALKDTGVTYKTYARADQLDNENIRLMKEMNFRMIYIGYEAGENSLLEQMNKKETTELYLDTTKRVLDAGIDIDASFIIGLPGETKKTLEKQIFFVEQLAELGLKKIKINRVLVLPGTPLYNRVIDAYPNISQIDSLDNNDMQLKLYSTYDLSNFGSVNNFVRNINETSNIMKQIITNKGGCSEGYGYNSKQNIVGKEL